MTDGKVFKQRLLKINLLKKKVGLRFSSGFCAYICSRKRCLPKTHDNHQHLISLKHPEKFVFFFQDFCWTYYSAVDIHYQSLSYINIAHQSWKKLLPNHFQVISIHFQLFHIQEDELEKKAEELKELTGQLQDHRPFTHQTLELKIHWHWKERLTRFIELLVSYTSHCISYYIIYIYIITIIII